MQNRRDEGETAVSMTLSALCNAVDACNSPEGWAAVNKRYEGEPPAKVRAEALRYAMSLMHRFYRLEELLAAGDEAEAEAYVENNIPKGFM